MELNEDTIMEVLLRLPVQSLVRYKSVCKRWRDIIEKSNFVNQHMKQQGEGGMIVMKLLHYDNVRRKNIVSCYDVERLLTPAAAAGVVVRYEYNDEHIDDNDLQLSVSTHCNGIVCLTNYATSRNIITLMNPALGGEFKTLPPNPFGCPSEFFSKVEGVGFGFDVVRNKYKVVRFVSFIPEIDRIPSESYLEAQVYDLSSSSSSWRRSDDRLHHVTFTYWYDECPPILFNGILHLCFRGGVIMNMMDDTYHILTFNITTELFEIMEFPKDYDYYERTDGFFDDMRPSIFVVDKYSTIALVASTCPQLCQYEYGNGNGNSKMDVWLMKEYGVRESWIKQYSLVLPPYSRVSKPLSLWKKHHLLFLTVDGKLMCSNLATGQQHQLEQYQFQQPQKPNLCPCAHLDYGIRELYSFGVVISNQTLLSLNNFL